MVHHSDLQKMDVLNQIKKRTILLGGNRKLRIYGQLNCASGKRMKADNRVFFKNEQEAIHLGYRPCGHCMREAYGKWKNGTL